MFNGKKTGAVILAAGKSTRMNSEVPKQFADLAGRPLVSWALRAFDESPVDEMVLVCAAGDEDYIKEEILPGLGLKKPLTLTPGGEERCDSVYAGIKTLDGTGCGLVLIHDGARPLVTGSIIERVMSGADEYGACVAAVPVKDTIRIANDDGFAVSATDRSHLWQMQTPQGFDFALISEAFQDLMTSPMPRAYITDDAMVAQLVPDTVIKLVEGSYENIKVTTSEDLVMAEALMKRRLETS